LLLKYLKNIPTGFPLTPRGNDGIKIVILNTRKKTMTTDYRRRTLAAVHVIKKALGMDDDAYRDALAMRFDGIRSAADLDHNQLNQWLLHLKSLQKRAGLNTDGVRHEAMIGKCEALWIELRKAGAVRNGSTEALQAFVQKRTGAAGLRMASSRQLYQTVEALKSWLARTESSSSTTQQSK
jgi:phage gp16-like protein